MPGIQRAPVSGAIRAAGMLMMAGSLSLLGGCSYGCPAVGLYNVVTVDLVGSRTAISEVSWVELCVDERCGVSAGEGAGETPGPWRPQIVGGEDGDTVWFVDLPQETQAEATATAYAADGSVLGSSSGTVAWSSSGVDRECPGGSVEGGPLTITLSE